MRSQPLFSGVRVHRGASLLLGLIALCSVACSPARFPKELYTVHGEGADYPIMVSRAPDSGQGRAIRAESGTHFSQSSSSYSAGNTTVTVTTTQTAKSEMTATDKLLAQVRRNEKYLQLEYVEFYADDYTGYGSSSADRLMTIEGKVVK